jgi:ankyrin repeat protein
VIFGVNTGILGAHFVKDGIRIRDGGEFSAYLTRESEEWTRNNSIKQARSSLLERGVPVTVESLGRCIAEKDNEAVSLFLQADFAADTLDKAGVPLLCLAARAGARDISALLLQAGASVNLKSHDRGGSALIDAALGKHSEILGDLLAAGADTDTKSKDGQSALIISVGLNDEAAVEMLLKAGANADDPDSLGASARKYAALFNRPGMTALFQKYAPSR